MIDTSQVFMSHPYAHFILAATSLGLISRDLSKVILGNEEIHSLKYFMVCTAQKTHLGFKLA